MLFCFLFAPKADESPFPALLVPKTKRQSGINNERLHAPRDNAAEATETQTLKVQRGRHCRSAHFFSARDTDTYHKL